MVCWARSRTIDVRMGEILCGLFVVLENNNMWSDVLGAVDWKEVGISRAEVEDWWDEHKEEDKKRIEQAVKKKRRDAVIAQLSPELREILEL